MSRPTIRYSVLYEKGAKSWGASVPDLPGCIAVAKSREDVEVLIREAIEGHLAAMRDCGIPVPAPAHMVGEVEVTPAA